MSLYKIFCRLDILRKFINAKIFTTKVFVHKISRFTVYHMKLLHDDSVLDKDCTTHQLIVKHLMNHKNAGNK